MPSPIRLSRRWTRKKPTAGASSPTIAPAANASRMNSLSNMDVRGVVPAVRQGARAAVEDDRPPDEDEPVDERLDGAELVRDQQDRHAEVAVQLAEEPRKRLLRVDVDARRRLVEHEQLRPRRQRLGHERALLLAAREPR